MSYCNGIYGEKEQVCFSVKIGFCLENIISLTVGNKNMKECYYKKPKKIYMQEFAGGAAD